MNFPDLRQSALLFKRLQSGQQTGNRLVVFPLLHVYLSHRVLDKSQFRMIRRNFGQDLPA